MSKRASSTRQLGSGVDPYLGQRQADSHRQELVRKFRERVDRGKSVMPSPAPGPDYARDPIADALNELRGITTCRCGPEYANFRDGHEPDCTARWREDVDVLAERIANLEAGREVEQHALRNAIQQLRELTEHNAIVPNDEIDRVHAQLREQSPVIAAARALVEHFEDWVSVDRDTWLLLEALAAAVRGLDQT